MKSLTLMLLCLLSPFLLLAQILGQTDAPNALQGEWPKLPEDEHLAASVKILEAGRLCAVSPFVGYSAKHLWRGDLHWLGQLGDEPVPLIVTPYKDRDLIKVTSLKPFPTFSPRRTSTPPMGEPIHLLGPLSELTLWFGTVGGKVHVRTEDGKEGFRVSALGASPAGSSGGCVWDKHNEVVGIVSSIGGFMPNERAQSVVIPVTSFEPIYGDWVK